jgi:hypothetical protein
LTRWRVEDEQIPLITMYLISIQLIDGQAFNVVMERICENIILSVRLSTLGLRERNVTFD